MVADYEERLSKVLDHLHRFRVTTPEVLHQLFFTDASINAVHSFAKRLKQKDIIRNQDLTIAGSGYRLGPAGAVHLSLDPAKYKKPVGDVIRWYGTLLFCCCGTRRRRKYLAAELFSKVPALETPGVGSWPYFLEVDENNRSRLGILRVDHGSMNVKNLLKSAKKDVLKRLLLSPAFQQYAQNDQLTVGIAVPTEDKQTAILSMKDEFEFPVPLSVEHFPSLLTLARHNFTRKRIRQRKTST